MYFSYTLFTINQLPLYIHTVPLLFLHPSTINQLPLYVPILFLFIFHNQSVTPLCTPSLPIYFPQPISYPFTFPSSSYTLFTIYQLALYVPLLLLFNFHINLLPLYAPLLFLYTFHDHQLPLYVPPRTLSILFSQSISYPFYPLFFLYSFYSQFVL